jgi:uncharacterized protein YkwD
MILTLLILINLVRVQPLTVDPMLNQAAEVRVETLCENTFSHSGWLKSFPDYDYRGENLAKGFTNDVDMFNAFMKSPTHRANILNKHYTDYGEASGCGITVSLFGGHIGGYVKVGH